MAIASDSRELGILGALLRHLDAEQIELVRDERPPAHASLSIAVSEQSLPLIPTTLHDFGRRNGLELVNYCQDERGQLFTLAWINAQQRPEFFSVLVRPPRAPSRWLARLHRWREPRGLLIACLGPDGSGRVNVIEHLSAHPLAPFKQAHIMDLRPHMMRPVPVNPESKIPRGRFGTLAKLMMFVADYWLGYWLQIRPKLVHSTLVVSNRYFDDILVDPRRYRIGKPHAFARWLLPWIPRPELWLVFDVASEVLQKRTREVAAEEAARLRGEYRKVLRRREDVVVLDASQPIEEVSA
ncbi:MAG: hypothetical protein ABW110_01990, partial [Steroidobacteraceae bacterium]